MGRSRDSGRLRDPSLSRGSNKAAFNNWAVTIKKHICHDDYQ